MSGLLDVKSENADKGPRTNVDNAHFIAVIRGKEAYYYVVAT